MIKIPIRKLFIIIYYVLHRYSQLRIESTNLTLLYLFNCLFVLHGTLTKNQEYLILTGVTYDRVTLLITFAFSNQVTI